MKCIRLHLLLFALLLISVSAFAGPRSFRQAKQIAERQAALLGIVMDESAQSQAKSFGFGDKTQKSQASDQETASYYVFPHGEGKGFTIVSGDDCLPEIVGYTDQGTYDEASLPESYKNFMKAYQEMVEALTKGDQATLRNLAEVKAYRSSVNSTHSKAVSPLLGNIAWNQTKPFNNMCPIYDGKNRAVTGCVATAMAQVMAYYKHPKQLLQDIPEYTRKWFGRDVAVPGISKSDGVYDWDNMLPFYSTAEGSYTKDQANAVAKLMFHCGAAVQMGYGEMSGANLTPAPLAKYFGYDADMMLDLSRSLYSLTEWTQILDNELAAGRPVFYSGSSTSGGHQFICDGSDGQGLYHINWGWGGYQDGYFDITILNPEKGGVGSGNAPDGYNRSCSMLVGVAPDNGKVDEPVAPFAPIVHSYWDRVSVFELTKDTRNQVSDKFALKIQNYFCNQSRQEQTGYIAYGIMKSDGTYTPISGVQKFSFKGIQFYGYTDGDTFLFEFDYAFPIGQTTIYAIYSTDHVHWNKCANSEMRPYVVEATAQKLTQVRSQLKADINPTEELLGGLTNGFEITIQNQGDIEYLGSINIFSNTTATMPDQAAMDVYVTVPAHSSITKKVELTPTEGDLYLWLTDVGAENVFVNGKKFTVGATPAAPVFTVVKAWTNAAPNEYETEKATYDGNKVKAPKTNDAFAQFNYAIKNDGGTALLKYLLIAYSTNEWLYVPSIETVRIPGNGATTTISRSFDPNELGGNTIVSDLRFKSLTDNEYYDIPTTLSKNRLDIVSGGYYQLQPFEMVVYVAGQPSGISTISLNKGIYGGNGEIIISSDRSQTVKIFNLSGQKVTSVAVQAGERQVIPVPSGIYIVNGIKVIVK